MRKLLNIKWVAVAVLVAAAVVGSAQTLSGTVSSGTICGPVATSPACSNIPLTMAFTDQDDHSDVAAGSFSIVQTNGRWALQFANSALGTALITSVVTSPLPQASTVTYSFSGVKYSGKLTLNYTTYMSLSGYKWIEKGGTLAITAPVITANVSINGCNVTYLMWQVGWGWRGYDWYLGELTVDECNNQKISFDVWF